MSRSYFVTGTDTGVGKTFVTSALARRARALGLRVFAFKPIETGCEPGQLGSDQIELCAAAGGWQTGPHQGVYSLRVPAAPLVAAQDANIEIDLDAIDRAFNAGTPQADLSLVEGAGGWRVPITESVDMAAFAKRLGLPVILVARAGLGTINHTLLTIEAIERDGCTTAAVVLSLRPDDDRWLAQSNLAELRRRWPGNVVLLETPDSLDPLIR